jgi:hypothetical protein
LKRRVLEGTRYYRQKANTLALSHPLRCPLLLFKQQHGTGILCPAILGHIFSVKFRFARFKITNIIALQQTRIHTVDNIGFFIGMQETVLFFMIIFICFQQVNFCDSRVRTLSVVRSQYIVFENFPFSVVRVLRWRKIDFGSMKTPKKLGAKKRRYLSKSPFFLTFIYTDPLAMMGVARDRYLPGDYSMLANESM